MKRILSVILLSCIFLFSAGTVLGQYENTSGQKQEGKVKKKPKPPAKKRWFAGGMLGAGFSSYSSYVEVSPIIGFKVTEAFQVGSRLTYIYNSFVYNPGTPNEERVNLHHYGASFFARYIFYKGLFGQAEYEAISYDNYNYPRQVVSSLFLGGGFFQNIGRGGFASFAILYNVLENDLYQNPIVIRIGFGGFF